MATTVYIENMRVRKLSHYSSKLDRTISQIYRYKGRGLDPNIRQSFEKGQQLINTCVVYSIYTREDQVYTSGSVTKATFGCWVSSI